MSDKNIPSDVLAAIAMALFEIQDEVHDKESNMLTIKRPAREYMPWASKEFGMLRMPDKK